LCTGQRVTRGRAFASVGKSHSCETPTTCSINPSAATISVAAGKSETIRITFYGNAVFWYQDRKRGRTGEEREKERAGGLKNFKSRDLSAAQCPYKPPTACEISRTTIVREIKIWTIARIFAQRASNGASVGPKVELCVKATNR
jgi:hypothetical protein